MSSNCCIVFICHGLNTTPSSFDDIKQIFHTKDMDVINITLPGHEGYLPLDSLYSLEEKWEQHLHSVVSDNYKDYESIRFVGYSLGALLITKLLINDRKIALKTTHIAFISPAFKLTTKTLLFKILISILPQKKLIKSLAPENLRANSAIPVKWYDKIFELQKNVNSHDLKSELSSIRVSLIIDKQDELTSYPKLNKYIKDSKQDNWNLTTVKSKEKIKHIIFTRSSLDESDWKTLTYLISG